MVARPGRPRRVELTRRDYNRAGFALALDPLDDWQRRGACIGKDPHWWFPEDEAPDDREWMERQAKSVCNECPVRDYCLRYALLTREDEGIWGGYNRDELARMRRTMHTRPRDPSPLLLAPAETKRESA